MSALHGRGGSNGRLRAEDVREGDRPDLGEMILELLPLDARGQAVDDALALVHRPRVLLHMDLRPAEVGAAEVRHGCNDALRVLEADLPDGANAAHGRAGGGALGRLAFALPGTALREAGGLETAAVAEARDAPRAAEAGVETALVRALAAAREHAGDVREGDRADLGEVVLDLLPLDAGREAVHDQLRPVFRRVIHLQRELVAVEVGPIQQQHRLPGVRGRIIPDLAHGRARHWLAPLHDLAELPGGRRPHLHEGDGADGGAVVLELLPLDVERQAPHDDLFGVDLVGLHRDRGVFHCAAVQLSEGPARVLVLLEAHLADDAFAVQLQLHPAARGLPLAARREGELLRGLRGRLRRGRGRLQLEAPLLRRRALGGAPVPGGGARGRPPKRVGCGPDRLRGGLLRHEGHALPRRRGREGRPLLHATFHRRWRAPPARPLNHLHLLVLLGKELQVGPRAQRTAGFIGARAEHALGAGPQRKTEP
mmetsp:Transcript_108702/g.307437  ORF Transcript_108702/g.307437 Transcript_108702/m.307437 type:complete len:483 (+) Transcript_108702:212-1660(+)